MKRFGQISLAIITVVAFVYAIYRFGFLRKPERCTPRNDSLFYSPANGTVVSVRRFYIETDGPYLVETKGDDGAARILLSNVDSSGTIITISLALNDVHYQRAPTSGAVGSTVYTAAKYEPIFMDGEARHQNTHNEILITDTHGNNYKVVQIAGFVARSIECNAQAGQWVKQGDVIGCIKLGSQVTVILPSAYQVTANPGDYVIDGETVLAKIEKP